MHVRVKQTLSNARGNVELYKKERNSRKIRVINPVRTRL